MSCLGLWPARRTHLYPADGFLADAILTSECERCSTHRCHRDDGYTLPAGVKLISERMKEAGYFTANVRQMPPEVGFKGAGKTDWNFQAPEKPFESDRFSHSTIVCPPSGTLLESGRSQLLSGLAELLGTLNSKSVSYGGQNKQYTVL